MHCILCGYMVYWENRKRRKKEDAEIRFRVSFHHRKAKNIFAGQNEKNTKYSKGANHGVKGT